MFYGWLSNLDGTRLPEFNHIVVRSKLTADGKYIESLIIETSKLFDIVLWIVVSGEISVYLAAKVLIPLGLWIPIVGLALFTFAPAIGTLGAYLTTWRNYPEDK